MRRDRVGSEDEVVEGFADAREDEDVAWFE